MDELEPTEITEAFAAFLSVLAITVRDLNRIKPEDHPSTYFLRRLRHFVDLMASEQVEDPLPPDARASLRKIHAMLLRGMES